MKGDVMIGISCMYVLDGGRRLQALGGRTAPAHQGSCVLRHQLIQRGMRTARRRFPGVHLGVLRVVSLHKAYFDGRPNKVIWRYGERVIKVLSANSPSSALLSLQQPSHPVTSSFPIQAVYEVQAHHFYQLLLFPAVLELFPHKQVVRYAEVFDLMEENVQEIFYGLGQCRVAAVLGDDGFIKAMCFCTMADNYNSTVVILDCYGSADLLKTLIVYQLRRLGPPARSPVSVGVSMPASLYSPDLWRELRGFSQEHLQTSETTYHQIMLDFHVPMSAL